MANLKEFGLKFIIKHIACIQIHSTIQLRIESMGYSKKKKKCERYHIVNCENRTKTITQYSKEWTSKDKQFKCTFVRTYTFITRRVYQLSEETALLARWLLMLITTDCCFTPQYPFRSSSSYIIKQINVTQVFLYIVTRCWRNTYSNVCKLNYVYMWCNGLYNIGLDRVFLFSWNFGSREVRTKSKML